MERYFRSAIMDLGPYRLPTEESKSKLIFDRDPERKNVNRGREPEGE